jgi:hypothetical protein
MALFTRGSVLGPNHLGALISAFTLVIFMFGVYSTCRIDLDSIIGGQLTVLDQPYTGITSYCSRTNFPVFPLVWHMFATTSHGMYNPTQPHHPGTLGGKQTAQSAIGSENILSGINRVIPFESHGLPGEYEKTLRVRCGVQETKKVGDIDFDWLNWWVFPSSSLPSSLASSMVGASPDVYVRFSAQC